MLPDVRIKHATSRIPGGCPSNRATVLVMYVYLALALRSLRVGKREVVALLFGYFVTFIIYVGAIGRPWFMLLALPAQLLYYFCSEIYWLKKVPIHMLFVTIVTTEVKSPRFHILKKEYTSVYATIQFDLFSPNPAWYKNTLNTPGVLVSFSQNKLIKIARFKCIKMSPVKRICVFEHSIMTNFNCACPAIQRGYGSGFLSEGSSWLTACMSELRRFWRDCADAQARLNLRCSHML